MASLIYAKDFSPIEDAETIMNACKGFGTNETALISILANRNAAQRKLVRLAYQEIYHQDLIELLKSELSGNFERAICLWTMDPAEREATLIDAALKKATPDYKVIIEIACTKNSEELLAVKRSYQSLYKHSLEEDVASQTTGDIRKLLIAVISTYKYDGEEFDENVAHSEANILHQLIERKAFNDDEMIRILSTRSKKQLSVTFNIFKDLFGTTINKGLLASTIDEYIGALRTIVRCINDPQRYLAKVVCNALNDLVNEDDALNRVIVTRAEKDLKEIKDHFLKRNNVSIHDSVDRKTWGNYKTFLLHLLGKE
ncbi:unnamed protein product [Lathyrus sativus]|nr:unnamed protein product [Lathyrus sativus]